MYNITRGNTIPMKAILEHEEERFPVAVSTNISVRAYNEYRYIDAENVTVNQEEDGVLYFEIPPTLNTGIFGVEVKGNVNGVSWRTATDGVVKITGATQRNDGSEAVPEGDTYDIVMRVQLYKQQSSDRAIEEHNSDETSHPYILGELERIEGEIPTLPEHIVTDANYVHTDNNFTNEEKTKLGNTYTTTQTNEAIEQAKEDVSWDVLLYVRDYNSTIATIIPQSRMVYISEQSISQLKLNIGASGFEVGDSFEVYVYTSEDKEGSDFIVLPITTRLKHNITSINRPSVFKQDQIYKAKYTLLKINENNPTHTWVETWVGGTATVAYTGSYNDISDKPTIPIVPTNVSAFTNDAGYITKTFDDLVNYYLKSETYTKTEVQTLINAVKQFTYEAVQTLPTATADTMHKIFLVPSADPQTQNVKDEYITIDNGTEAQTRYTWEQIGSTEIDLSGYYTSQQTDAAITAALNAALANYTTTAALTLLLAGKQDVINDLATIRSGAAAGATAYQKPQGGIPSTDMSQGVQESLSKANTALQQHQDISGKEDVTTIVTPVNQTDETLPVTALSCEVGKYYRLDVPVETLAVTLPAMTDLTTVRTIVIYLTGGTTPAVTISSTAPTGGTAPDVYYQDGYAIEAGKTYEVNCLWNGDAWIVASVEISLT